jgi:hypothetical protein
MEIGGPGRKNEGKLEERKGFCGSNLEVRSE